MDQNKFEVNEELRKDMENLMKDMQQVDLHLNLQLIPEKVILLLGQTKAGKTTLMYYLLGKKLIREQNKDLGLFQMKPQAKIFDALIGNDYQSTTVYPNIPTELGEDKVLIIDMPGFSDTRYVYRLLNIYIVREVIKKIKSVHVSLVIPNSDLGANELINTIDKNCLLLNHKLLASPGCLSFILTKIDKKEDEIEAFHDSMKAMKEEKEELFDQIDTVLKAKTYIFENKQPQVQAGLQLKSKIISQNKFFPIDQNPDNLLSSSYAQVISGQRNQQQFEKFLIDLLDGIVQTLKRVVELFSVVVQLHHLQDLQSILMVQQQREQDLIQRIYSLINQVAVGDLKSIQLSFSQSHQQTTKIETLLNLCKKYYWPKNTEQAKPIIMHSLQNFVESASILANQQSKVCLQLRKRIHRLFIFITNGIRTIYLMKNKVIADYVEEIFNSAQIATILQSYSKFAIDNDLIVRIAHSQGCEQLSQNQEFRELILAHNPDYAFQEGEEVIENVKVAVRGEIKNKKMNAALQQTMKPGSKNVSRQQNQGGKIKNIDISRDSIKIIKNMPISSTYLNFLLDTFSHYRISLQNACEPIRIQFGVTLFRKIAYIMQKLQMFEEACLFYLAIPSEIQAQYLINTAISFKQLQPNFVKQILLPYYSRVNTNFQMVQKLYNYLLLNIYDYNLLLQNQSQLAKTLEEMRDFDTTQLTLTKRFEFNFINSIDIKKKDVIERAKRNEKLLINSKFMSLQREIMKLQHL